MEWGGGSTFLSDFDAPELVHPVVYSPWGRIAVLLAAGISGGSAEITTHRAAYRTIAGESISGSQAHEQGPLTHQDVQFVYALCRHRCLL